jgi:DNA repair protein RadC
MQSRDSCPSLEALPIGTLLPDPLDAPLRAALTWLIGVSATRQLLSLVGSYGVLRMSAAEIASAAQISPAIAERVVALRTLGLLFAEDTRVRTTTVTSAIQYIPHELRIAEVEYMLAFALDNQHRVLGRILLAKGSTSRANFELKALLTPLVRLGTTSFILIHCHPSGNPLPSEDDLAMTREVARFALLIGLVLLDHLIVARDQTTSLVELGLFP